MFSMLLLMTSYAFGLLVLLFQGFRWFFFWCCPRAFRGLRMDYHPRWWRALRVSWRMESAWASRSWMLGPVCFFKKRLGVQFGSKKKWWFFTDFSWQFWKIQGVTCKLKYEDEWSNLALHGWWMHQFCWESLPKHSTKKTAYKKVIDFFYEDWYTSFPATKSFKCQSFLLEDITKRSRPKQNLSKLHF